MVHLFESSLEFHKVVDVFVFGSKFFIVSDVMFEFDKKKKCSGIRVQVVHPFESSFEFYVVVGFIVFGPVLYVLMLLLELNEKNVIGFLSKWFIHLNF